MKDRDSIAYEDILLARDTFVIAQRDKKFFDRAWEWYISDGKTTGECPHNFLDFRICAVEVRHTEYLELNLLVDQSERFHGVLYKLPRKKLLESVRYPNWQKRPYLIVSDDWYDALASTNYTTFALVDAIGVRDRLNAEGCIDRSQLIQFRRRLSKIAARYRQHVILSFADSVLIKSNWKRTLLRYRRMYTPEHSIRLIREIQAAFRDTLAFDSYAVITQGITDDHSSKAFRKSLIGHHLAFNSLGTPFAQLYEIEKTVRESLRIKRHAPASLYLAQHLFLSLKLKTEFRDKYRQEAIHFSSGITPGAHQWYFCSSPEEILANAENRKSGHTIRWLYFRTLYELKRRIGRLVLCYRLERLRGVVEMGRLPWKL